MRVTGIYRTQGIHSYQMEKIKKNIQYCLRLFLGNYILLSELFKLHYFLKLTLVRKHSDICIEGFPRSGNTFFVEYFLHGNNISHLGHHLHVPSQIYKAKRLNIPCVVLYREPKDAIASLIIMDELLSMNVAIRSYIHFYKKLMPYSSSVLFVNFKDATARPHRVIENINEKFHTHFVVEPYSQALNDEVTASIRNSKIVAYSKRTLTVPNEYKTARKKEISARVENNRLFEKAQKIYMQLEQEYNGLQK